MADVGRTDAESAVPPVPPGPPAAPVPPPAAVTIADPGALGLAAFAMTTFVLSCFNAGLVSQSVITVVLPLAFFYGGLVQILAGMWEFRRGNTFAATAFASFGAFWLAYWGFVRTVVPHLLRVHQLYQATGLFLLAWTIFTAYMAVAAARTTAAVLAVFVTLDLTFLFLTIGAFGQSDTWTKVGGWAGLVTAAVAWYASFAIVTNSTFKRTVLPVVPLGGHEGSPAPGPR
ncbi:MULTISPECIES: acetate uptake transporter [unclassified Kitasatospora]|uniref:acetate uptake transporter n=1 Tax=unclassified Kitasatospora TaxID=2633591 RepID=UPI002E1263C0|nr:MULTISPECIES: acetate uptake transporter [unclassified Kitasatospora]